MKTKKLTSRFLASMSLIFMLTLSFQSCEWIENLAGDDDSGCEEEPDSTQNPCDTCSMVYKPNIYLYPQVEQQLEVGLSFPQGGSVITSIPEYGEGWSVNVDPQGIIDGEYGFLFYESVQPDVWQREQGWCIRTGDLEEFFRNDLETNGFRGREIDDFVEYWVPRLSNEAYYLIYPQIKSLIDQVIRLNVSGNPDQVQRLFYLIEGSPQKTQPVEPITVTDFSRQGFFVTEWGVIME
ncbi:MAG: hypothetical protein JW801_18025 [Bacteroidales bacterium]|nr:hypothetical protein [Bacteroidales bacterium]